MSQLQMAATRRHATDCIVNCVIEVIRTYNMYVTRMPISTVK